MSESRNGGRAGLNIKTLGGPLFLFIRNGLEILNQTLRKATFESSYIWGGDWCRFRVNFPMRDEILVRALKALEIPENQFSIALKSIMTTEHLYIYITTQISKLGTRGRVCPFTPLNVKYCSAFQWWCKSWSSSVHYESRLSKREYLDSKLTFIPAAIFLATCNRNAFASNLQNHFCIHGRMKNVLAVVPYQQLLTLVLRLKRTQLDED